MTSSALPAWLPGRRSPAAPPSRAGGRHSAPEFTEAMASVAGDVDQNRRGRHAEPEWDREIFDPRRDDDPFDWLGFTAEP